MPRRLFADISAEEPLTPPARRAAAALRGASRRPSDRLGRHAGLSDGRGQEAHADER